MNSNDEERTVSSISEINAAKETVSVLQVRPQVEICSNLTILISERYTCYFTDDAKEQRCSNRKIQN